MSAGDQYVPTAIDQVADVLAERDEIIRNLRAELDRVRGEGMDAVDREDRARTARDAANLENARLTLAAQNAREILQAFTPTCAQAPSHREMRRAALAALAPKEPQ